MLKWVRWVRAAWWEVQLPHSRKLCLLFAQPSTLCVGSVFFHTHANADARSLLFPRQRLKNACRADPNWGPALKEHRTGRYAAMTSEDAVEDCPLKEREELKEEQKERKDDISLTIQGSNGSTTTHNNPNPSA